MARSRKACAALGVVLASTLVLASSAEAAHEVDHHYLVLGYVRDAAGRPVAGAEVRVVREKTGLSYQTTTEADGFYFVVVRLYDANLGDSLQVTSGAVTIRIHARFDPRDARTPRGTRVDVRGGEALERPDTFAGTLSDYLKP